MDGSFSDISGRYQHGRTITGDPTFDDGPIGKAASFDGDTEVSFGNVGAFDRASPFSVAVWLKGRGSLPMSIFQKLDDPEHRRGYEWRFEDVTLVGIQKYAAQLAITFASDVGSAIRIRTHDRLRLGQWYQVTLTYDGSGRASGVRLYVDGQRYDVDVQQDTLIGSFGTTSPLRLGSKALGKPFYGAIDDLRLYSRVLTTDQIQQLAIHYRPQVIVAGLAGKRSKEEADDIREYFLTYVAPDPLRALHGELVALQEQRADLEDQIPTTMVMAEMKKPRDTLRPRAR